MCPSYMATRNEKDTTRGRANVLREFLTNSEKINRFDHEEIKEVMDLLETGVTLANRTEADRLLIREQIRGMLYGTSSCELSLQDCSRV